MNTTNNFKLKLLKSLSEVGNPYIDIRDLESRYDTHSIEFTSTFQQLESENLISSDSNTTGLKIGCDGDVQWSVVKLYVTTLGKTLLNPPKKSVLNLLWSFLNSQLITGILVATVTVYLGVYLASYLNKAPEYNKTPTTQHNKEQQDNTLKELEQTHSLKEKSK